MQKVSKKPKFKCEFCSRVFQQFFRLSEHTQNCEFYKRTSTQHTEEGITAHKLWSITFKDTARKKYDYATFIKHREYKFFMDFAAFCCKINVLDAEKYMDWCIKERIKPKLWSSEFTYERFVKHFLIHEEPVDAVLRSVNFINHQNIDNFFATVHPGTFLTNIETGRISPWLYLLYWDSNAILSRMNEDHKKRLQMIINPSAWSMRQQLNKDICDEIKKTLKKEIL